MANFRASQAGFEALAESPAVQAACIAAASKAKAVAEGIAADIRSEGRDEDYRHYADSFEVRPDTIKTTGKYPVTRAGARLQNTSGHAAAVEWGYAGREGEPGKSAHHVLARTAELLKDA